MKRAFGLFNAVSFATGGAGYGLFTIPLSTVFAWKGRGRLRRNSHPRFVLGFDKEKKRELSVDAWALMRIKNGGKTIPFEGVVMRWGPRPLKSGDILVKKSECDSGSFYVARHIWGDTYFLDNGKTVSIKSPINNHCNGGGGAKVRVLIP